MSEKSENEYVGQSLQTLVLLAPQEEITRRLRYFVRLQNHWSSSHLCPATCKNLRYMGLRGLQGGAQQFQAWHEDCGYPK